MAAGAAVLAQRRAVEQRNRAIATALAAQAALTLADVQGGGDLRAIKQACTDLGIVAPEQIELIFHSNAARLIDRIEARKQNVR